MTTLIISVVVAVLVGFCVGYPIAYYGTMKMMVVTLNKLIASREQSRDSSAAMELPGLTLFRAVIRQRRFES